MPVEPKRATVSRKANDMKNYAVPILRMRENLPTPQHRSGITGLGTHNSLRAATIATTVTPRLTQGPQSAVPAIIATARSGKNALPKAIPVLDKKPGDSPPKGRRFMTTSIRDSWKEYCPQLYSFEKKLLVKPDQFPILVALPDSCFEAISAVKRVISLKAMSKRDWTGSSRGH